MSLFPKQPPHNIEVEQALLGAVLIHNESLDKVLGVVAAAHFYEPLHGAIFETMASLISSGKRADYRTLTPLFEHAPPIGKGRDALTVKSYLGRLAASATSVYDAKDYAQLVRDLADARRLIEVATAAMNDAFDMATGRPIAAKIEAAEAALFALTRQGAEDRERSIGEFAELAERMVAAAYERNTSLYGLSTGFRDLDAALGGLAPSDLIIVAGRPSMGKSALAAGIGVNVARDLHAKYHNPLAFHPEGEKRRMGEVSFYSLEMSGEQLAMREMSSMSSVAVERMRRGLGGKGTHNAEADFRSVQAARKDLRDIPFQIDATGALSIGQLSARARRRKRTHDTRLIIIDYLQLMTTGDERRNENRVAEVTKITMALKSLAKELDVPLIALSQLSRQVEQRPDKRPQLSDLRESGSIEQDADIVGFVYREEYYLNRIEPTPADKPEVQVEWKEKMTRAEGVAEFILGKHRHGAIRTVYMGFDGKHTRFKNDEKGLNTRQGA